MKNNIRRSFIETFEPVMKSKGFTRAEDVVKHGNNWYGYCHGNPLAFVDLNGLYEVENEHERVPVPVVQLPIGSQIYADITTRAAINIFETKKIPMLQTSDRQKSI